MIAPTTIPTLTVCPRAQARPSRQASSSRPWRVASVETTAKWSGSKACRSPSTRPRAARADRLVVTARNLPDPLQPFNPKPYRIRHMELTTPGVATLRRDLDQTGRDAETAHGALAASGDGRAFERLYRTHVARIHSLARRMTGEDHADDLTQDVFVRARSKLSTFRAEAAFGTWLHRLAVNVILARRTTIGTERGRYDDSEGALDGVAGPAHTAGPWPRFHAGARHPPSRAPRVGLVPRIPRSPPPAVSRRLGRCASAAH